MVREITRVTTTMKLTVNTGQAHIDEGECGLKFRCMEKLAVTTSLINILARGPKGDPTPEEVRRLHVSVDGAFITFNFNGYRWKAPTPAVARNALIYLDQGRRHMIKPHRYTITAERKSKIAPMNEDRREQINRARQRRAAEGRPDKAYRDPSVHQRVVGLTPGYGFVKPRRKSEPLAELH